MKESNKIYKPTKPESSLRKMALEIMKYGCKPDKFNLTTEFPCYYCRGKGLTWENHGFRGWHIDHIKPRVLFDLSKKDEQMKCFHYTNLQPLWWKNNISKGCKY